MALFKILRGSEETFNTEHVPLHEGWAYFTDKNFLYIDVGNSSDADRKPVNAYAAKVLLAQNGQTEVRVEDLVLQDDMLEVTQGGTGHESLELNALLVGNGEEAVKLVKVDDGSLVVGDEEAGVRGLRGTGALYAPTEGNPTFGTLPISAGGTGGGDVAAARCSLDVYSKDETDNNIGTATTKAYTATLTVDGWTGQEGAYTQSVSITTLTCGKNHNVPPIVTFTSNLEEYSKIDKAEATEGVGITFTTAEKPQEAIGIIVTDNA